MAFIADLHIHSHYSLATSPDMVPEGIWQWAQMKGISVVGTGDATHPGWLAELQEKLEPAGNGLFTLKAAWRRPSGVPAACRADVFFMLSAEISCVYRKDGRTRKVHCLVFFPDMDCARRLSDALSKIGSVASDGRPILKVDAAHLLRMTLDISDEALFVPAHAWTPHYSVFGAASGFDSLEECFGDLAPYVHAIETGLSSDPAMNRRVSGLDRFTLISNSDAHSPSRMGREANIFAAKVSYGAIRQAIVTGGSGAPATIEFFPEEGKYHYDGHAACGVRFAPVETIAHGYRCPACGRRLTVGVAHRVELLADRQASDVPGPGEGFRAVVPLAEILSEVTRTGTASKAVKGAYMRLLSAIGSELTVLLDAPLEDIKATSTPLTAEAIDRMRRGKVRISPGYDGQYGRIKIFEDTP
jgi:uncharacterized protein (TIGR00375 family)